MYVSHLPSCRTGMTSEYMHACIHAYMDTYVHTHIHTYIPMYIHTYIHTYLIFELSHWYDVRRICDSIWLHIIYVSACWLCIPCSSA